ncbi:hypothetical protein WR25_03005 [Diploscapter pachys]|uniref:Uncharacterized protein n=1 Tax=Diploscapter pachys TaxID=2018661 RepID=A0A2A2KUD1_9BILA|nr:hypothetical protein WR25_03005 [Diploscapter pachys]
MLFKEYKDTLSETDQLTDEEFKEIETSLNEDAKIKIEKCDNRLKFLKQNDTSPKLRELDDEFFQLRNNSEFVNGTEAYRVKTVKKILNNYDQDLLEKWNDVLKKFGGEFITENAPPVMPEDIPTSTTPKLPDFLTTKASSLPTVATKESKLSPTESRGNSEAPLPPPGLSSSPEEPPTEGGASDDRPPQMPSVEGESETNESLPPQFPPMEGTTVPVESGPPLESSTQPPIHGFGLPSGILTIPPPPTTPQPAAKSEGSDEVAHPTAAGRSHNGKPPQNTFNKHSSDARSEPTGDDASGGSASTSKLGNPAISNIPKFKIDAADTHVGRESTTTESPKAADADREFTTTGSPKAAEVDRESMDHISTETSKPKGHRKSTQSSSHRQVTTYRPSIETPATTESISPDNGNAISESDKAEIDSLVSDLLALINFPIVSHSPFYSLQRMANTTIRNICCQARRAAHHGEYHSKYCDPYVQEDSIARMKRSYSIYSAARGKSYGNGPMYFPNQRRTEGHKKLNRRQRKFLRLLRSLNSPLLNRIKNATKLNQLIPLENICSYIDIQTNGVYPQKILDSWMSDICDKLRIYQEYLKGFVFKTNVVLESVRKHCPYFRKKSFYGFLHSGVQTISYYRQYEYYDMTTYIGDGRIYNYYSGK